MHRDTGMCSNPCQAARVYHIALHHHPPTRCRFIKVDLAAEWNGKENRGHDQSFL